ncbi:MAG TPA: hypothetical protein VJ302_24210 [Blastocatellia bacterium]|nr:hypothetical protein [Blastocatellia bacterium]
MHQPRNVDLPEPEAIPSDCELSEEEIDYNLMETFPASDPPSWTLGIDRRRRLPDLIERPSTDFPSHQNQPPA